MRITLSKVGWALGLAVLLAAHPGCSSRAKQDPTTRPARGDAAQAAGPQAHAGEGLPDTAAEAQRLAEALQRSGQAVQPEAPQVRWLDERGPRQADGSSANPTQSVEVRAATKPEPVASTIAKVSGDPAEAEPAAGDAAPAAAEDRVAPLDRAALVDELMAAIGSEERSAMVKAMSAAMLTLIEPGRDIDPALYQPLDIEQREQVARFQSVVELFRHQLVSGDGQLDRGDIEAAIDEMFGASPITIKQAKLCRRVDGYGVYKPFDSHTFLAGREHKMIVYLELDNFVSRDDGTGQYEVRLEQELALYTEWDGQKVWAHKPVELVDRSRNQRRDFYTIQIITLPARLSVGKYILKVDVTDTQGGSVDGKPIEIAVVADQALVQDDRSRVEMIRRLLEDDEDNKPLRPVGK